jgi:hypothetical protein
LEILLLFKHLCETISPIVYPVVPAFGFIWPTLSSWKELREKAGAMGMRRERLIGDPKFICHTLEFVEKTGTFTF